MIAYYKVLWTMPASLITGKPLKSAQRYDLTTHSATAADMLSDLLILSHRCCNVEVVAVEDTEWPF